jgi:hypothetical protein
MREHQKSAETYNNVWLAAFDSPPDQRNKSFPNGT